MTLADLMKAIALLAPFFASVTVGNDKGRSVGLLIGLIVGVVVSVVSFRGFIVVQNWGFGRLSRYTETSFTFALAWLWLLVLLVWIVGFSYLGAKLTECVVLGVLAKASVRHFPHTIGEDSTNWELTEKFIAQEMTG